MLMGRTFNFSASSMWPACVLLTATATLAGGCDTAQLVAPTRSTITISAATRILSNGGATEISAYVLEEPGTPVQNGTSVRFTTTLGTVNPENAQTHNGVARAIFSAGSSSGIAEIRATSGSASGGTDLNLVRITVGAAAVSTISLRANPGSVGPSGGTVELIASAVSENGQGVEGVLVTFSTDQGTLGSSTAMTNPAGEARTTLTTGQETNVTAAAGTKTSVAVKVTVRAGPIVAITCAPASGTGNCAGLQATAGNSAIVLLTVTKPTGGSNLRNVVLDFGDGESVNLGNLASGSAAVSHSYAGPSGSTPRSYTATVRADDVNGESTSATTSIVIVPRSAIGVSLASSSETATIAGQRWTFTATAIGVADPGTIQSYSWDFGDDVDVTTSSGVTSHVYTEEGKFTVTVTLNMVDGRTASATTEILINLP
jgi:adhesin/invasin